jgi:hypothetical protein
MRRSYVIAMALTLALAGCGGGGATPVAKSASSVAITSVSTSASPSPVTSAVKAPSYRPGLVPQGSFGYVPLWPFASVAQALRWQRGTADAGRQAWHLDAGEVAVAFARQYLSFTEINRVVSMRGTANEAHVSVGYTAGGTTGTAAVIHLVRIGSGTGRPWEVVGTDDTANFSLTQPRYGSTVAGTITVGGHIAGVDESIRVTARQLFAMAGSYCCLPAGTSAPWSVRLALTHTQPGPVTIVASTGGHVAAVERFTVTGVRSGS